ncbi:hypothetical protein GQ42DRAFT_82944 [Ramicandelaber brevisporus]|nr:hypothetical protein GQ42DRAFT_82944 [Ramicandelaber brevisporus]
MFAAYSSAPKLDGERTRARDRQTAQRLQSSVKTASKQRQSSVKAEVLAKSLTTHCNKTTTVTTAHTEKEWRTWVSIPLPCKCESHALPFELDPQTDFEISDSLPTALPPLILHCHSHSAVLFPNRPLFRLPDAQTSTTRRMRQQVWSLVTNGLYRVTRQTLELVE